MFRNREIIFLALNIQFYLLPILHRNRTYPSIGSIIKSSRSATPNIGIFTHKKIPKFQISYLRLYSYTWSLFAMYMILIIARLTMTLYLWKGIPNFLLPSLFLYMVIICDVWRLTMTLYWYLYYEMMVCSGIRHRAKERQSRAAEAARTGAHWLHFYRPRPPIHKVWVRMCVSADSACVCICICICSIGCARVWVRHYTSLYMIVCI